MDLRLGSRPWMYPSHPMASHELRRDISTAPPIDIRRIWKLREEQNCPVPSGLSVSWLIKMKVSGVGKKPQVKTKMTGCSTKNHLKMNMVWSFSQPVILLFRGVSFLFGGEKKRDPGYFLAVGTCGGTIVSPVFFLISAVMVEMEKSSYQILSFHRSFSKLSCNIGGAKEPGMMYFPTKWGAKELQNPPNHRVVKITALLAITIQIQMSLLHVMLWSHSWKALGRMKRWCTILVSLKISQPAYSKAPLFFCPGVLYTCFCDVQENIPPQGRLTGRLTPVINAKPPTKATCGNLAASPKSCEFLSVSNLQNNLRRHTRWGGGWVPAVVGWSRAKGVGRCVWCVVFYCFVFSGEGKEKTSQIPGGGKVCQVRGLERWLLFFFFIVFDFYTRFDMSHK